MSRVGAPCQNLVSLALRQYHFAVYRALGEKVIEADWAFFAARVNMTSAFLIAAMGLLSARAMCGWRLNITIVILLTLVSVVDIATVWTTNLYFTGEIYHYAWGTYIAGNRLFFITPLLITFVAFYGVFNLWANYRNSHPFRRNRPEYLLLANFFLLLTALDFLPHFGINIFAGPLSGIAIPLFLRNVQLRNAALPFY